MEPAIVFDPTHLELAGSYGNRRSTLRLRHHEWHELVADAPKTITLAL